MADKTYFCGYDLSKPNKKDDTVFVFGEILDDRTVKILAIESAPAHKSIEIVPIADPRQVIHGLPEQIPIRTQPDVPPDEIWFVDLSHGRVDKVLNPKEEESDADRSGYTNRS